MRTITGLPGIIAVSVLLVLCLASRQAQAEGFDGSTPLLCALTWATDCDSSSGCTASTVEELKVSPFFRLDLGKGTATAVGPTTTAETQKVSEIKVIQRREGLIFLQGIDLRGWSVVISEKTGKMTLAVSGDDEAFVLFGVCTEVQ